MVLVRNIFDLGKIRLCMCKVHARNYCMLPNFYDRDPSPLFLESETQHILKSITQFRFHKIFRKTSVVNNNIEYKFMTSTELEKKLAAIIEIAQQKLEMPPVVKIKNAKNTLILNDVSVKGFSDTKFIVTDITFGLNQSLRKISVRQIDGNLEYSPMKISKRMNQIYVPLSGRKIQTPFMFESENLEKCMNEQKYEFVLDRLTLQYEPYEEEFHVISNKVYLHINKHAKFDELRSTRHFGPMAFFLAWHKNIDDLLYEMIKRKFIGNAVELIALMYKLNDIKTDYKNVLQQLEKIRKLPAQNLNDLRQFIFEECIDIDTKSAVTNEMYRLFLDDYITNHSSKKVQLELALKSLNNMETSKM